MDFVSVNYGISMNEDRALFDTVCDGDCPYCSPEDYYTTVDVSFLRAMRNMYDCLSDIAPDHVSPYWKREIEKLSAEAIKIGTDRKNQTLDKSPEPR